MSGDHPRSTAQVGGHPLHPLLIPFPIVSFIGVLVTDIIFLSARQEGWATAGDWLLGIGLVTALIAASAGYADYRGDERIRRIGQATRHMIANIVVVTLEAVNLAVRLTGGNEQVSSLGIWLSAISVAVLAYSGWLGGELVYRHGIGVRNPEQSAEPTPGNKFSRDRR